MNMRVSAKLFAINSFKYSSPYTLGGRLLLILDLGLNPFAGLNVRHHVYP